MAACNDPLVIETASPGLWSQALWLVFAQDADQQRAARVAAILAGQRRQADLLDHLLLARRGTRLVGAVWGQQLPGRAALVWPPQRVDGEGAATARALLDEVCRRLAARGTVLAQALLATGHGPEAELLREGGFQQAAELLYLASDRQLFPREPPSTELEFVAYAEHQQARLAEVIERTYVDTLDVPALNGVRQIEDVLEGYRGTGRYDPQRWFFLRAAGADVGCLLLADHEELDQWELVYMGLEPAARGRGWSHAVTRFAQWQTGLAGRGRLILAVDAANDRALATYARAGFVQVDRRTVLLRVFAT